MFNNLIHILVGDLGQALDSVELFVVSKFEFRNYFDAGFELERLPLVDGHVADLGRANDSQVIINDRVLESVRKKLLEDVVFDVFAEALLDDGSRDAAGPETRDLGKLRVCVVGLFELGLHLVRGNLYR